MSNDFATTQGLNAIFSFLNHLDSIVFWISSADFKRQLYVSKAYTSIWGRSCESLQTHPESWLETLLSSDRKSCLPEFKNRTEKGGASTITFRIKHQNGETRWIKDISHTLVDNEGTPLAIVGIGESIQPELWNKYHKEIRDNKYNVTESSYMQNFLNILKNEYALTPAASTAPDKTKNSAVNTKQKISINNKIFLISKRQAECLAYLQQGLSAKQTARALNLSPRTIEFYLENLRKKFNCANKIMLISKISFIER